MTTHTVDKLERIKRELNFVPVPVIPILPKAARDALIEASRVHESIRAKVVHRTIRKVMKEFPMFFKDEAFNFLADGQ